METRVAMRRGDVDWHGVLMLKSLWRAAMLRSTVWAAALGRCGCGEREESESEPVAARPVWA